MGLIIMNPGEIEKSIMITNFIYLHDIFNMKDEFLPAGTICVYHIPVTYHRYVLYAVWYILYTVHTPHP